VRVQYKTDALSIEKFLPNYFCIAKKLVKKRKVQTKILKYKEQLQQK
jgi:hypothetical protein